MQQILEIPKTLAVVTRCWRAAETELRASIENKHPDLDEECITKLFYDEFAFMLRDASDKKEIRFAFLKDLQMAFPNLADSPELNDIPNGLIARADLFLHKKARETHTGGDLGLTIVRPQVDYSVYDSSELTIVEYHRGLLCQAKIKRRNGKWGSLTNNQKDLFPDRMKYLALLLYTYADDVERRQLKEFKWQLCEDGSLADIQQWLKSNSFPSAITSEEVIALLGSGRIGTNNPDLIEKNIRSNTGTSMMIRIFWPPGKYPSKDIRIYPDLIISIHH